jgi:hypothetical protein
MQDMLLQAVCDGDLRLFKSTPALPRSPIPAAIGARMLILFWGAAAAAAPPKTRCFAGLVRALDKGRGRLREAVEPARTDRGDRALHVAAGCEQLEVCSYLVEGLRVDVNVVDDEGLSISSNCLLLA